MGAPKGNEFWKLRSKHGRDKLFETPEKLWKAACEYFQWCKDNPWLKTEQGKGGLRPFKDEEGNVSWPPNYVELPIERPLTLTGLCLYLDCNTMYFSQFKKRLNQSDKQIDKDFSLVITRIEDIIYTQKFEGAAVGTFNANIIARDLGLKDKSEIEQTNTKEPDLSKLTYEQLLELKGTDS